MSHSFDPARGRGFTLIELLITLLIVSVGMLGLAKLQAAAVAESQVSRIRSLMTFQAKSLTGMMQSNRTYWGATTAPSPGFTLAAGSATAYDPSGVALQSTKDCGSATCTAAQIAAYDISNWATAFNLRFPSGSALVACTPAPGLPTTCDVTLTSVEHYVAINRTQSDGSNSRSAADTVSIVLHVQP